MMSSNAFLDVRKMESEESVTQKCMEDYLKEFIEQEIHTINQDHIIKINQNCCNGTSLNNCWIRLGKKPLKILF